ncbi:MFS general substrate transporter [Cryphonectria parasitica EP155]|uniref:MFS general substrate transporter n=1 Tax=Cryphonectria parasitica (strain ATCC 38755 / EP155) TaxID=660469 RepID=A0A9P4Y614_CRYP1|nr:MFS general substrate transporter [Cryphonectria parasitica EP155]KAF3767155.1 MFS general substrate transporter [Cryphonectria parasitica EP155]
MGLGILEDRALDHVPGTTRYFDDPERTQYADDDGGIAATRHRNLKVLNGIILVPQPSDDPNDPLNWPLWRRDLITFILSISAIFATCLGPILAANTVTISLYISKDFTDVALLTGYFLLGTGFAAAFFVPSSRVWGKRHAFLLGMIILIFSSVWGGVVGHHKNYNSFLWARIIQGVGCAPFEALVNAAVGDLYFVHQRGSRMAFTNLAVFGGAFFTPILVGKITHTLEWWWTFWLVAIFCGACLPALIFLCPETSYRRDTRLNTDMLAEDETTAVTKEAEAPTPPEAESSHDPAKPVNYWKSIALFNGRKTDEAIWKLALRPFPLFLQPAFLWACLIQGTLIGWTVFIGVILGAYFIGYPLWWNEVKTGYAYVGPFVGALLGFIIAGLLSDWSARAMTRWNKGVYEPEFRILLVIPQLVFGVMGVFGWGITVDGLLDGKWSYVVPLMFFGFEVCGMVIGAVASSLYIVDAYRDLAIEGFTCMIIFKNMFAFGLTFKAYDWLIINGTKATPVFNALGAVQVVICMLSVPMYIFGKRIRSFYYRHDILKILNLR